MNGLSIYLKISKLMRHGWISFL